MSESNASGFALFDTSLGVCAIAWTTTGVAALRLPEANPDVSRAHVTRRLPHLVEGTPNERTAAVIDDVQALLRGERRDFDAVRLDMAGVPDLHRAVYDITRTIAPGDTRTYGEIARQLGDPMLAQSVGQALGANPFTIVVPCHRVLAANGKLGGFSAFGSIHTKRKLLAIESAFATRDDLFSHAAPIK